MHGERRIDVTIDGHLLGSVTTHYDPTRAEREAIPYVDDSIARPDAYTWTRDLTAAQLAAKVAEKVRPTFSASAREP